MQLVKLAFLMLLLLLQVAGAQHPDTAMTGSWTGRARITSGWVAQRELAVSIDISSDGTVAGSVGDATLTGARLSEGRSPFSRALRLGREHVVSGGLAGPLIRTESIVRAGVLIFFDWTGSTLRGELQSSGTFEGTRDDLLISATGLVMERPRRVATRSAPRTTRPALQLPRVP